MILDKMIIRQEVLQFYKEKLVQEGHLYENLIWLDSQLALLEELIKEESFNVMNKLLQKTNFRLLESVQKGLENIIKIINNAYDWNLAEIEGNESEWLNDESLIFNTENHTLVFSKNQLNNGHKYINNKWQ